MTKTQEDLTKTQEDLFKTQDELTKTKDDLAETKDELAETQDELAETQDDLTKTQDDLEVTQKDLKTTKTSLKKTQNVLTKTQDQLKATQKELKATKTSFETTHKELAETKKQLADIHPVSLMRELVKQNPTPTNQVSVTTNQIYASKVRRVLNAIVIGQIHQINANECFFKLFVQLLPEKKRIFRVTCCEDVKTMRNESTVFSNDSITLNDYDGVCYSIFVSIKNYEDVSLCFLIDIMQIGRNCKLQVGKSYPEINWDFYRNDNGEILLYFRKKLEGGGK